MDARTQIKDAAERAGLRQRDLAEQCGTSEATISRILSGEIEMPRADLAVRLAAVLGLDVRELFGSPKEAA